MISVKVSALIGSPRLSIAADSFCHVDFQDLLFRIRFVPRSSFQKFQIDTHPTHRSLHIITAHSKIFFQILWIAFFHFTIRISCWEMGSRRGSRLSSRFLLLSQELDPDRSTTDLQRSPDAGVPLCTPLSSHSLLSCPYIHSISHVLLHAAKKMDIIRSSFSVSLVSLLAFSFSSLLFPVQCMPVPLTL